jgi:zinc transporter ZupT
VSFTEGFAISISLRTSSGYHRLGIIVIRVTSSGLRSFSASLTIVIVDALIGRYSS